MQDLLTAHNLSWSLNSRAILTDINLNIQQGECFGILGPNGSGKTSLLRCLYGGVKPSTGFVSLLGEDLASFGRIQRSQYIAVVLQEMNPNLELSVDHILRLGRLPYQKFFTGKHKSFNQHEEKIIAELELEHLLQRNYSRLSGGEKQRVMLGRALFQKPKILFLDEPTNHLDISHQLSMLSYVSELAITVVCTLHDLNLSMRYCDRVAMLNKGHVIAINEPQNMLTSELIKDIYSVKSYRSNNPHTGKQTLDFY